jgi:hypothetical protein
MDLVYIDDIDYNNKEELIQWFINNIDDENNEEIDDKVVEYLISSDIENIIKLDNYVRKHFQNGSKDSNPCCREKYGESIDCIPYCLGCKDPYARLRKYFHLIINLKNHCEKLVIGITTKEINFDQQNTFIDKLLIMCKEFLPIEQSSKILQMVLEQSTKIDTKQLINKFINND